MSYADPTIGIVKAVPFPLVFTSTDDMNQDFTVVCDCERIGPKYDCDVNVLSISTDLISGELIWREKYALDEIKDALRAEKYKYNEVNYI